MNIPKIVEILGRSSSTDLRNAFVDGALRTDAVLVTTDSALRVIVPGHTVYSLEDLERLDTKQLVLFDYAALLTIIRHLTGTPAPVSPTVHRASVRVINSSTHVNVIPKSILL